MIKACPFTCTHHSVILYPPAHTFIEPTQQSLRLHTCSQGSLHQIGMRPARKGARACSLLLLLGLAQLAAGSRLLQQQTIQEFITEQVKQQVAGPTPLPSLSDLGSSIDFNSLVNSVASAPSYQGPTRLVVPVRAVFNTDCSKVTSSLQESTIFQSAIRFALTSTLELKSTDRVNVSQIACSDQGLVLDLDVLLDDTVSEDDVQRVVQQITQAAQSLVPSEFLRALNIEDFTLTCPINLDNIPAIGDPRQYLPPLPDLSFIPAIWNEITSAALPVFNGSLRVQLPFQLSLPCSCSIVAPTQEALQSFKQDLQTTISQLLDLADSSYISINKVTCSTNSSALIDFTVLIDDATAIFDIPSLYNAAKTLAGQVKDQLQDKYTFNLPKIVPEVTQSAFNWTQSLLQQLKEPVQAFTDTIRASIPTRLSFDADCAAVLSTAESTNQFKAVVQFALSVGLDVPAEQINITQVACGSVVVDLSMLVDEATNDEQVQTVVNQLNADTSSVFPDQLKTLMGVTGVSGQATLPGNLATGTPSDQTPGAITTPTPTTTPTTTTLPTPSPGALKAAGSQSIASMGLLTLAGVASLMLVVVM